ncbi:MAG TPA: hypothetical protein VKA84_16405 [Gemmatimonadaceae bacterium]|nr:hypothetical protein [Gemmatimonadaceae bacterium]
MPHRNRSLLAWSVLVLAADAARAAWGYYSWEPLARYEGVTLALTLVAVVVTGWRSTLRRAVHVGAALGLIHGAGDGIIWAALGPAPAVSVLAGAVGGSGAGAVLGFVAGGAARLLRARPRFGIPAAIAAGAGLLYVGMVVVVLAALAKPFGDRRFDRGVWAAESGRARSDSRRASMTTDLGRRLDGSGMPRAAVVEMLGEPDMAKSDSVYSYNVGMWTGFRIDYDSFDVLFDGAGRVARTRVVQH